MENKKINLIIAPVRSGKTYYIFSTLLDATKKSFYLCDTSNKGFYINKYNCTVMTYAKWFYEMNKLEYACI